MVERTMITPRLQLMIWFATRKKYWDVDPKLRIVCHLTMAPRRRPTGASHEVASPAAVSENNYDGQEDGTQMEDVSVEAAPLNGALLAQVAIDQAGPPLALGLSSEGCVAWTEALNIVAVLSTDAVHLARPAVRDGVVVFDHGFVSAQHIFSGEAVLRQICWIDHERSAQLVVLSSDGRVRVLKCSRSAMLVQESWIPSALSVPAEACCIAALGKTLCVLVKNTVCVFDSSISKVRTIRLQSECCRIAAFDGARVLAFGSFLCIVNTADGSVSDPVFSALQWGPVCAPYVCAFNAVYFLGDAGVPPFATLPADQPIAALVPHGSDLLAVTLDGTAFCVSSASVKKLGTMWSTSAGDSQEGADDEGAGGGEMTFGYCVAGRCALVVGVQPRAVGIQPCTHVALLDTQPASSSRARSDAQSVNSDGGYVPARRIFERALFDGAHVPVTTKAGPCFQAPFGVCRLTGRAISALGDLCVCTVCGASYSSPVGLCGVCHSGPALPFVHGL